ncbi:glutathione peroxidase [Bacillus sp. FJAT-47783]|uniref:glutathione peroxidase n=1 Tax=Bacillus sp. FJAT-47783 TaxID=2922712 RepID=UPI001FAC5DE1|nr:glutathione peroxidase [Bacillus sp. FJAT-47783]
MDLFDISVRKANGQEISLRQYKGNVLLIVNTASKCGFTPQYKDLQALYEQYNKQGFDILAFPCNQFLNQEPGSNDEIESFCQLNYGVTFDVFAKCDVNGEHAHPLFRFLTERAPGAFRTKAIKWNFTKFLVDRDGKEIKRFSPQTNPRDMKNVIEQFLTK